MLSRVAPAALVLTLIAAEPGEVRIRTTVWAPSPARISVQTNLVEVGAVVRDRRGDAVGGFQGGDFRIADNGKPQTVSVCVEQKADRDPAMGAVGAPGSKNAAHTAQPEARSIALWIDDSHAGLFAIDKARTSVLKLIDTMAPNERMGIYTSSGTVTVELTRDGDALRAAVAKLRHQATPGPRSLGVCPDFDAYRAYIVSHHIDENIRHAAIQQAIACNCQGGDEACIKAQPGVVDSLSANVWEQLKGRSVSAVDNLMTPIQRLSAALGSRILLILSPGFITGDMGPQLSGLMDSAIRAHIVVNALNPDGLTLVQSQRVFTAAMMREVAAATGGRFIQNDNEIAAAARTLIARPDVSYVLGFYPSQTADEKMHTLKVGLPGRGGYHVDAREGYFAAAPDPAKEDPQKRMERAAMSQESLVPFPVVTAVAVRDRKAGGSEIHVEAGVDVRDFKFGGSETEHVQQIAFLTLLEDEAGAYITGKMSVMDLRLSSATLANFQRTGIRGETAFIAAPGRYRVRQVIREAVQNRVAASETAVEVK
jgi:VWFA-related protein